MPIRSSKDHDVTTVAKRVVEQAIGETVGRRAPAIQGRGQEPGSGCAGEARRRYGRGGAGGGTISKAPLHYCEESSIGAVGSYEASGIGSSMAVFFFGNARCTIR